MKKAKLLLVILVESVFPVISTVDVLIILSFIILWLPTSLIVAVYVSLLSSLFWVKTKCFSISNMFTLFNVKVWLKFSFKIGCISIIILPYLEL